MSKTYSLKTIQHIPAGIDAVWDFFSSPANLKDITPSHLGFQIKSRHHGAKMYPGQIIEYTVKPLFGIPLYWMTEITQVQENRFFIDEQRFGPYELWHHQHHFAETSTGVMMTDIVHYRIPFWIAGDIAHSLFVKAQLRQIFGHRIEAVEQKFGKATEAAELHFFG